MISIVKDVPGTPEILKNLKLVPFGTLPLFLPPDDVEMIQRHERTGRLLESTAITQGVTLDRLLYPACRALTRAAFLIPSLFPQGRLNIYLFYTALTLCVLLIWMI